MLQSSVSLLLRNPRALYSCVILERWVVAVKELALSLNLVAIRLMLRLKIEVLMGWTKEHFTADP